jgi:hypothetical protein
MSVFGIIKTNQGTLDCECSGVTVSPEGPFDRVRITFGGCGWREIFEIMNTKNPRAEHART